MSLKSIWRKRTEHIQNMVLSHGVVLGYGGSMLPHRFACDVPIWDSGIWKAIQHITTDENFSRLGLDAKRCTECIRRFNEWSQWRTKQSALNTDSLGYVKTVIARSAKL